MSASSAHDSAPEPTSRVARRRAARLERAISLTIIALTAISVCMTVLFYGPIAEAVAPVVPGVVSKHPLIAGLVSVVVLLVLGTVAVRLLPGRARWVVQVLCLLGAIGVTVVTGSLILSGSQETRDLAPGAPEVCGQTLDSCEDPAQAEADDS